MKRAAFPLLHDGPRCASRVMPKVYTEAVRTGAESGSQDFATPRRLYDEDRAGRSSADERESVDSKRGKRWSKKKKKKPPPGPPPSSDQAEAAPRHLAFLVGDRVNLIVVFK